MNIVVVYQGQEFVVEVGEKEPVVELKRKIEGMIGVPAAEQNLSVAGWEFIDGLDMEDYPIVYDGTKVDLNVNVTIAPNFYTKFPVVVKLSSKQIAVDADATDTVRILKEKIHIVGGTPVKNMSLFCCGVELADDFRSLSEYAVGAFSEIVVYLKSSSRNKEETPTRKLSIVVQASATLLDGASIPVEAGELDTVDDVRKLLLSQKVLPQDDYFFIHKQRIMEDHCTLKWHGVESGDRIYVFKGYVTESTY